MVVDLAKIERLEMELREAKAELWKEDGERYRILVREISLEDRERILKNLTSQREDPFRPWGSRERRGAAGLRPGASGGDLECSICGKSGLTKRGLGLHMVRLHKEQKEIKEAEAAWDRRGRGDLFLRNLAGVLAPRPPLPAPSRSLIGQQAGSLLGLRSPPVAVVYYVLLVGLESVDPRFKIADACFQVCDSLRLDSERDRGRDAPR
jgi:hypothetical protein